MIDWPAYRRLWPHVAEGLVWLQHAGVTPPNQRITDVAKTAMDRFAREPAAYYPTLWRAANDGARAAVARFLGCPSEELALVKNTSQGLLLVAEGYPWRPGDNVVTLAGEYPANRLPWQATRRHGVEVRVVEPDDQGRFPVERVAAAVDARTRLVAVSWVQYLNGFRIDLAGLREVCQAVGALLVVDGVQGVGVLPVDLTVCDALAVGGHKWLCGTEGAGFLWLAPRLLERLQPVCVSWHSVAVELATPGAEVAREDGLPPLKPGAERFEEGTPNVFGNLMLAEAVTMLAELGPAAITARILAWQDELLAELEPRGYEATSSRRPAERSGILALRHPAHPPPELLRALRQADIIAIQRGDAVRLAPHFYNDAEDLARVVAALP